MSAETEIPNGMDKTDLILYRLDQQAAAGASARAEVKEALALQQEKTTSTFTRVFDEFKLIDSRLTANEKWRYGVSGAMGVMVLLIGWIVTLRSGH